jgi:CRP/FNR family cyclic AMP-dependent transcriptional regulator
MSLLLSTLAKSAIFEKLPVEIAEAMQAQMQELTLENREVLFLKGDVGDRFYVVLQGALKVTECSVDGDEVLLSILGPGMALGEMALLDGDVRSANVHSISDSKLAYLDQRAFQQLLLEFPVIKDFIIKALCNRIRALSSRVEQLMVMSIPERLANVLLGMAVDFGNQIENGCHLPVKLSQSDFASMVGTSRESINKLLKQWEHKGWLSLVNGRLQITRADVLKQIADGVMT